MNFNKKNVPKLRLKAIENNKRLYLSLINSLKNLVLPIITLYYSNIFKILIVFF